MRKYLIFFLALLQLIAPLVHAHANGAQMQAGTGLHLPGLEFIAAGQRGLSLQAVVQHPQDYGISIGISCGVQGSKMAIEMPVVVPSQQRPAAMAPAAIVAAVNFSPPIPFFPQPAAFHPLAPRAPPFLHDSI